MVNGGGPQRVSDPDGIGDELLDQWQERLSGGEDPVGALADVLAGRGRKRSELFSRVGAAVFGYRLERILGAGGAGVTYAAVGSGGERVAIKLVVIAGGSSGARFERECQLLDDFSHPSIVAYRAHGVIEPGVGALVMELVDGADLEQVLQEVDSGHAYHAAAEALLEGLKGDPESVRSSPIFQRRVLELAAKVADGLSAVHVAGVVHRDVKPANILVTDDLSPRLIDFGFAREWAPGSGLTMSGIAIGTVAYMAPEQLRSSAGAVGDHTDTYGLGLVIYRALLGKLPHSHLEDLADASRRRVRLTREERQRLPQGVQAVLDRALQAAPSRRYRNASEMASELRKAAAGERLRPVPWLTIQQGLASAAAVLAIVAAVLWLVVASAQDPTVVFVANCRNADAVVEIDGEKRVLLDQAVELPVGEHTAQLLGDKLASPPRRFELSADRAGLSQQVFLVAQYVSEANPKYVGDRERTAAQFMSGHSVIPLAPTMRRDRRWVDGREVLDYGPFAPEFMLRPGAHIFAAEDAKGRRESMEVRVGPGPLDVLLLPACVADIDGAFRCTWTTVLSPRPEALEFEHTGKRWVGPAQPSSLGGAGLMALPCSLSVAAPGEAAESLITVRFPEPMQSAVVFLRARCGAGASLQLEAKMGDAPWEPWPRDQEGDPLARMGFSAPSGAADLQVRATMQSDFAPSRGRAEVEFLQGMLFGGHWVDDPPCLAVVADPGNAAALPMARLGTPVAGAPLLESIDARELPSNVVGSEGVMLSHRPSKAGAGSVVAATAGRGIHQSGVLSEWSLPALERVRAMTLSDAFPLSNQSDPTYRSRSVVRFLPVSGSEGSWMFVGGHGYPRGGKLNGGRVWRLDADSWRARWQMPNTPPSLPFGDDGYGGDVHLTGPLPLGAVSLAEGLLVSARGFRRDGDRVGKLALLDLRDGAQRWEATGTPDRPFSRLDGVCHQKGAAFALICSERRSETPKDYYASFIEAVSLDERRERILVRVAGGPLVAAACSKAGGRREFIVSGGFTEEGHLLLQKHQLDDGQPQLLQDRVLQFAPRFHTGGSLGPGTLVDCPDCDGDGVADLLYLSQLHGTGRTDPAEEAQQVAVLISCASLRPIARIESEPGRVISSLVVVPGESGGLEVVGLIGSLVDPDVPLQLHRYQLR